MFSPPTTHVTRPGVRPWWSVWLQVFSFTFTCTFTFKPTNTTLWKVKVLREYKNSQVTKKSKALHLHFELWPLHTATNLPKLWSKMLAITFSCPASPFKSSSNTISKIYKNNSKLSSTVFKRKPIRKIQFDISSSQQQIHEQNLRDLQAEFKQEFLRNSLRYNFDFLSM